MAVLPWDTIFDDFNTHGNPLSGIKNPRKEDIRDSLNNLASAATAQSYATRAAIKAADVANIVRFYLTETGREGNWIYKTGNYATQVTADTVEGLYMAADGIATTVGALVRQHDGIINAKWFGATGDNSTDDKTALQNAVKWEYPLHIPAGIYKVSAGMTYTGTGTKIIFGDGRNATVIILTADAVNGITKNSTGTLIVRDLAIKTSTVDMTSGSAILLSGAGSNDVIDNCSISGTAANSLFDGIVVQTSTIPVISRCYILNCKNTAITLSDAVSDGAGLEANIRDCTFNTAISGSPANVAINWLSGIGTVIVTACRFQSYAYGILAQLASGTTTSSLIVNGCTFENNPTASITASLPASSTAIMQSLAVTGCLFNNPTGKCIVTAGATNTTWIGKISITGCDLLSSVSVCYDIQVGSYLSITGGIATMANIAHIPIVTAATKPTLGKVIGFVTNATTPNQFNGNGGMTYT